MDFDKPKTTELLYEAWQASAKSRKQKKQTKKMLIWLSFQFYLVKIPSQFNSQD